MLLGSMLAGQAFANSPVAAVHALAIPLAGISRYRTACPMRWCLRMYCVQRCGGACTMPERAFVFPALADMGPQEAAAAFAEEMAGLAALRT